jgi:hypothetical protein
VRSLLGSQRAEGQPHVRQNAHVTTFSVQCREPVCISPGATGPDLAEHYRSGLVGGSAHRSLLSCE